ncbi:MAG TPA: serine/threonine-protein kinase [Blastocatellia bacterium]|jgi:serine/threonine protein kinase|nr:serine/threonine-protein kinase [Blastocatellia bacterium]
MLAPNTLLQGRYLVMRLLGQGGMGAVYQATDRKFGNAVALKETFYNDLQLRKAFSHEARLLNRLRHAALPVVTDYFAIGERQFLVMQYIPGKDLEQLLADRKAQSQGVFLSSQVLRWADQLLDALEYLHSQKPPIIHRDIKPQNLKLTPRGEVILLDFGLAKGIVTHQSQVSQSIRGYTPNYASLEQIRGTGTDARSDIYSIGATMYHLLTGEMPQDALTRIAAILMSQPDPLKSISAMNPEVPELIAQVIEKAMAAHPDQRYSSAAAMRQALRSVASSAPPPSLHRAQTLTDEPLMVNAAAVDPRPRNGNRGLPPPPVMRPESAQSGAAQAAAKPAESQITDHVIVLLDKVGQNTAGKSAQGRNSRRNDAAPKAAPGPAVQERTPPVKEVPSKDTQEKNLRVNGARGNGFQENVKQVPRRKDVRGKSFFLRKVQQQQEKKSRASRSWKQNWRKALQSGYAVALLVTLTVGVAAYQTYKMWPELFTKPSALFTSMSGQVITSSRFEALRYYLEITPSNEMAGQKAIRATGFGPVEAGAKFRFHFKPTEDGYFYVIALGENGAPQTFLTSRPIPSSGVDTNSSAAGRDFHFPDGEQWFMTRKDVESTPFTVIFSKTQLKVPAFFSSEAGRDLSAEERKELMDLKKRYAANTPDLVAMKDGNQPFVSVQSPERASNEPIIFDVSIKRQ